MGVTSMILGIFSMVGGAFFFIPPILAVIFGHVSRSHCKKDPNLNGSGMAMTGLLTGYISLAGLLLFLMLSGASLAILADATNSSESWTEQRTGGDRSPQNETPASIGDVVSLNDSTWEVVAAEELGSSLPGGMFAQSRETEGKFLYVRYQVTNDTNSQEMILFTPAVVDSQGRRFDQLDMQDIYLPDGETSMTMEQLPAGVPRTFSGIYEVPSDANGFSFIARSFAAFGTQEKMISLDF